MAVSVDTVYQRVLTLANKEQRGYITPQEFNLLANQAQMSIFESYFYTKNNRDRLEPNRDREQDETDLSELIAKKLGVFQSSETVTDGHTFPQTVTVNSVAYNIFQTGRVFYNNQVAEKVSINEADRISRSLRHVSSTMGQGPVFSDNTLSGRDVLVYSGSTEPVTTGVTVECFREPANANWAYVVVNDKAMYNSTLAVDFELHRSEEDTLVNSILELAGIVINKPGLAAIGTQKVGGEQALQKT